MSYRLMLPARTPLVLLSLALALPVASVWTSAAVSQTPDATKRKATPEEEPLPPEEVIDLLTEDGVAIKASFLPGTKGKESVPVILLHGYEGSRKDFAPLALLLQQQGHAVLVPDLRGHGDSTRVRGVSRPLEAKTMSPRTFAGMVTGDMEACKRFLMEKNDKGELNIDKLCLVGAEMGSVVAMEWARIDWSWPPLATGKQGQDVKAVVLISPPWSFRGLRMKPMLDVPAIHGRISTMILVGKEDKQAAKEAKRIHRTLQRAHPKPDPDKPAEQSLWLIELPTRLQGTKMLGEPTMQIPRYIAAFLKVRAADQKYLWKQRKLTK